MNNEIRPPTWFALVACAAFIGGFSALWLTDFVVVRANWCSGVEAACLREWIAAFSGWAAAAAAIATLSILRKQLDAMRRQTDFVNGFADPEITVAIAQDSPFYLTLTIRNWNRNQIEVFQVLSHPDSLTSLENLKDIEHSGGVAEGYQMDDGTWVPPEIGMTVLGWTNRNEPPPYRQVNLFVTRKDQQEKRVGRGRAGFRVHVRFYDDRHRTKMYDAWVPDAFFIA